MSITELARYFPKAGNYDASEKNGWLARPAFLAMAALAMVLLCQLSMVFTRAINWDEFWFYNLIEQARSGLITQPLQTFHVRVFAWLPELPGTNIDKIIIGRMVMLGCEAITIASIMAIARRFMPFPSAAIAALSYVTAGFVMQHGFSFRTDPIATALLMSSLTVLCRTQLKLASIIAFALLTGLAAMITIKVALYAPVFAGMAWLNWSDDNHSRERAVRIVSAGLAALVAFGALYCVHAALLPSENETSAAVGLSKSAAGWAFFLGLPPYLDMLKKGVETAPVMALAIVAAPLAIWNAPLRNAEKIALTACCFPALTPFFYINTAAYYYAFMLAPVAVAAGRSLDIASQRYGHMLTIALLAGLAAIVFGKEDRSIIQRQQLLVEEAQTIFPTRVAYFDHDGILPDHEKVNWLMTPSTLAGYWQKGQPSFTDTLKTVRVPMLVANWEGFESVMNGETGILLPEDERSLRTNYTHFWGPVWVAGRTVNAKTDTAPGEWAIPGRYRVQGGSINFDGISYAENSIIDISRGTHSARSNGRPATLIWSDAKMPERPWSDGPIYELF